MVQTIESGFDIRPRTSIENVISCDMRIIPLLIYVGSGIPIWGDGFAWDDRSTDIVLSWLKSQTVNVVYAYDPIH